MTITFDEIAVIEDIIDMVQGALEPDEFVLFLKELEHRIEMLRDEVGYG
jgi:hypothetical protein